MGLVERWREIAETLETGFQFEHGAKGAHARESARVRRQCANALEARDKEIRADLEFVLFNYGCGHNEVRKHLQDILKKLGG